jgi:hypothetical protein
MHMRIHSSLRVATFVLATSLPATLWAQVSTAAFRPPRPSIVSSQTTFTAQAAQATSEYGSFALQAVGGTLGSIAGVALGLAVTDDCTGDDDIVCAFKSASVTGALGAIGATAGVAIAGRSARQKPSIVGAFLGAAVGTVAGIGIHHLLKEEMNQNVGETGAFVIFTISQGVFAAAGARVISVLR